MNITFSEEVGSYTLLRNGSIIIYNDELVKLTLQEEGAEPMHLEFQFQTDDTEKSNITQNVDGNTMRIKFTNFNVNNGVTGIFEPVEVATADDGSLIFLSLIVHTFDAKEGNRLLIYSLYTRK